MSAEFHPDARLLRGFRPSPLNLYFPTLFLLLTGLSPASVNAALEANIAPENIADKNLTPNRGITELRIWTHAGPEAELDHAKVVVKNAKGVVVGHGRTSPHGTLSVKFQSSKAKLPLRIFVQGGKEKSERFRGHLTALVDQVSDLDQPVHVDLISSAALKLAKRASDYASAITSVRHTLRIGDGAPDWVLRVRNNHVHYEHFKAAQKARGSFDQYVVWLAKQAKSGQRVTELEPLPVKIQTTATTPAGSKASIVANALNPDRASAALVATATTSASTPPSGSSAPTCTAALGTAPSGTTSASTTAIEDFGAIGIAYLADYSGVVGAASSVVAGMLFSGGSSSSTGPAVTAINSVITELNCISSQISYLSEQISELTYQVDVQAATQCNNAVQSNYQDYQYLINNASSFPLTSSNTSLISDIDAWGNLNTTCGSAINDALFGTGGGQGSSFQAYMANNYNPWMTVSQIQDLQTFLSYWGTVEYEQLVLQNEYYNWNDQVENSLATSGVTGIDQNGNPYCLSNTSSNSANFCAYINNIRSVFPPDVYTDELVIIGNGLAINAFPGGLAQEPLSGDVSWGTYYAGGGTSSNNIGPLGLTASFMANHVMNFHANSQATFLVADNTTVTPTVPGLVTNAGTLFNSLPSNTTSGSVQEGYSLQIAGHYPIEYSDLNGLGGQQYGTQNATSGNLTFQAALVAGLGQDTDGSFSPTGLSSAKYSASDIYFLMADSTFGIENPANNKSQMWFSWVAVGGDYTNGSYSGGYNGTCANNCIVSGGLNYWDPTMAPVIACGGSNPPSCPSNPGQPPVFAVLLKRNWWNESTLLQTWAQASNTNPPALAAPPTFSGLPPSGLSTIALSPTSVQITFTAPEAPSGYTIQGYVGGCSGTDSSGSIVSGTVNGTASPLAVSTLQDGLTYECAVQTQYSNGSGTVITSTSSNSAKASTAVPTAPTINSISSPAAGELQINFTPSNSNGGSAITNYVTACTDSGHSTGYAGGTTSPALVKNLTGGVAYTCNMVAQNVNGYSPSSNLMVATPSQ